MEDLELRIKQLEVVVAVLIGKLNAYETVSYPLSGYYDAQKEKLSEVGVRVNEYITP